MRVKHKSFCVFGEREQLFRWWWEVLGMPIHRLSLAPLIGKREGQGMWRGGCSFQLCSQHMVWGEGAHLFVSMRVK